MTNDKSFRLGRIEKLLQELQYEVTRGIMEGEIDESLTYRFCVPVSRAIPDGVVSCEFHTRPVHRQMVAGTDILRPRLKLVKS